MTRDEDVVRALESTPLDDRVAWAILALAPNAILLVHPDGHIVLANQFADEMFGYEAGGLLGAEVNQLVPEAIRDTHRAHREAYHANPKTRPMGIGLDLFATRQDRTTFPVEIALSPLDLEGETHVVVILRDITDRLAAEAQLQAAEQELHLLEDRERIARDLHDTVIQRLFAAGMTLQATAAKASPEVEARVERVIDELDATIRDIRQTIFRLTAHTLAPTSLRRRIVAIVEQEEDALGFAPELRFDGAIETVDEPRAEDLLAVLREALSNVGRHAGATAVQVTVAVGAEISVVVDDDGSGMAADVVLGGGLANMSHRAEERGGRCAVEARSPRGTSLRWAVPADD